MANSLPEVLKLEGCTPLLSSLADIKICILPLLACIKNTLLLCYICAHHSTFYIYVKKKVAFNFIFTIQKVFFLNIQQGGIKLIKSDSYKGIYNVTIRSLISHLMYILFLINSDVKLSIEFYRLNLQIMYLLFMKDNVKYLHT